jgi:hypothetical protein
MKDFFLTTWCILRGHRWGPWTRVPFAPGSPGMFLHARYCGRCKGMDITGDEPRSGSDE